MDEWEEKYMPNSESNMSETESETSEESSTQQKYTEHSSSGISAWPTQIKTLEDDEKPQWNTQDEISGPEPPLKRSHSLHDPDIDRPFKRQTGPINLAYVDILNEAIHEAASRASVEETSMFEATQIGMTHWSSLEKARLYGALSSVGKHNVRALATRIGTKSIIEVQAYLQFVSRAAKLRHENDKRSILFQTDYPAAAELSQSCCYELEKAADSLALSQQVVEEKKEYEKWESCWDISPVMADHLERRVRDATTQSLGPQFATFFHVPQWLELSCRVFMNSSVPASNWTFVDDKPPSIWATALEDFYSLTVSFTRRLVHASLQASQSRIMDGGAHRRPQAIEVEDVHAAAELLGISRDSKESWRTCPRRLRLNIYEKPEEEDHTDEDGLLSYNEIENRLGDSLCTCGESEQLSRDIIGMRHQTKPNTSDDENTVPGPVEYDTEQEIRDILVQTRAARIRGRQDYKSALISRVVAERRQTAYADDFDTIQSQQAETGLWAIMGKDPPMALTRRKDVLGRAPRSNWKLDELYRKATDWTTGLYHEDE